MNPLAVIRRAAGRLRSGQRVAPGSWTVSPAVDHRPLAGVARRTLALALDLALCVLLSIPVYLDLVDRAVRQQAPGLPEHIGLETLADPEHGRTLYRAMLELARQHTPESLPPAVLYALSTGDTTAVDSLLERHPMQVNLGSGQEDGTVWRDGAPITLGLFSLVGERARTFGLVSLTLVYFTLLSWLLRGFTPGKWLAGVRVVRLDGSPLRLWDSFGRAGGYSASLSTLMLGFLEVFWEHNRMCLHDRIVGTVVLRHPRLGGPGVTLREQEVAPE